MRGRCYNCRTERELVKDPPRMVLHALPQLASPVEIEVPHRCRKCGRVVGGTVRFTATNKKVVPPSGIGDQPAAERRHGHVWGSRGTVSTSLNYPGGIPGQNVLFPAHEGRLSAGHAIDRYGNPDLMAKFAAEYLKQYWVIVPKGRLPQTVSETELVHNRFCHVGEVRDPELIWPSRHELTIAEIRGPAVMACVRCRDPRAPTRKQG